MLRFSFKRYRMCILVEHFTFVYWKQINRYTSQQLLCYSKGSFVLSLYKENLKKGAEIHMKKLFFQVRNDFQWVLIILFSSLYIEYILLTFEHMKRMKPRDLKVDNLLLEFQPPTLYFAHAYIYIYIENSTTKTFLYQVHMWLNSLRSICHLFPFFLSQLLANLDNLANLKSQNCLLEIYYVDSYDVFMKHLLSIFNQPQIDHLKIFFFFCCKSFFFENIFSHVVLDFSWNLEPNRCMFFSCLGDRRSNSRVIYEKALRIKRQNTFILGEDEDSGFKPQLCLEGVILGNLKTWMYFGDWIFSGMAEYWILILHRIVSGLTSYFFNNFFHCVVFVSRRPSRTIIAHTACSSNGYQYLFGDIVCKNKLSSHVDKWLYCEVPGNGTTT